MVFIASAVFFFLQTKNKLLKIQASVQKLRAESCVQNPNFFNFVYFSLPVRVRCCGLNAISFQNAYQLRIISASVCKTGAKFGVGVIPGMEITSGAQQ